MPHNLYDLFYTYINTAYGGAALAFLATLLTYRYATRYILKLLQVLLETNDKRASLYLTLILEKPLRIFFILIGLYAAWQIAPFGDELTENGSKIISSGILYVLFWTLYRSIPYAARSLRKMQYTLGTKLTDSMVIFLLKFVKVLIVILGVMSILQKWNVNVVSFMAALGLGGVAISLAAKSLLENYFGTLSIFIDKMFTHGDRIKIDQIEGVVLFIGMRSTLLKLPDGGSALIPNGQFLTKSILNYSKDPKLEDELLEDFIEKEQ